ncbi:conjugal transfer protein TraH [Leisingera sp. SS27]|uniref:conjugal transfer protein TraH n=1 Tax=Leisingera sp. SS27 TaxID=2979462 RepID=UPI00232F170E|nr:conjugal transfer protein TraH [Leisingera sp. SS27]MDC0660634.1 conjugal transfer protein TraH [Leisingera sp. SS27]
MKRNLLSLLTAASLCAAGPAAADVGDDLKQFWERTGGGVNVTKPTAYKGQQAGYATLGSLYLRTRPRNSQLAAIQLPSVRAGCGGIDIFGGAFSFITEEELIALMEAIMQNAAGFAFELALESLSPAVQEIVAKLRDLIQQVNAGNINSCEAGQLLTASLWPKMDGASQHICQTIGGYNGIFADRVASRHGCGTGGQHNSTMGRASGALAEQVPTNVNYAWRAVKKNDFLASSPRIAEFFMTLTGTIITTAPEDDDSSATHRTIPPRALSPDAAKALVEGGSYKSLRCDETNECLNPVLRDRNLSASDALFAVTADAIQGLSDAISNDTAPPDEAIALINLTTIPVYKHLVTAKSYKYQFVQDDINSMAELVAVDLAIAYIDEGMNEILNSAANVDIAGDINREFQETVRQSKAVLQDLRASAQRKYAEALRNLERLSLARGELAASSNAIFSNIINQTGGQ